MARTALTVQTPPPPSSPTPLLALAAQLTFAAADASNFNSYPHTGRELLLIQNPDSAAHTVTLHSVAASDGRTGDITTYSIPATSFACFQPFPVDGWRQADGNFYLDASSAELEFAVVRLLAVN